MPGVNPLEQFLECEIKQNSNPIKLNVVMFLELMISCSQLKKFQRIENTINKNMNTRIF